MKTYILTERNQWEGERWNFFVRMTEDQATAIRSIVNADSSYRLEPTEMDEAAILERVSRSQCRGYMPSWNDLGVLVTIPDPSAENPANVLYKGGLRKFCEAKK